MESARHKGLVLGVTGPAGSGKSTVTRMLASMGAQTVDADALVRWAYSDGRFRAAVAERFGNGILGPDGSISRAALAEVVFSDPEALEALEALVHPAVLDQMADTIEAYRRDPDRAPLLALEIPLLFETGAEAMVDKVLTVSAAAETRARRLSERGWSAQRIAAVERFQMSPEEKEQRADCVIRADGAMLDTSLQVEELWQQLT